MRIALLLVFIAVPLLEIALLIKAGDSFGFWPTITIVILTAVLGTVMLRWQGLSVMARANTALREGRMPVESVADGAFLLLAGAFLLTPGLLTDAVGLAFLIPQVRQWIGNQILQGIKQRMARDAEQDASEAARQQHPNAGNQSAGPVIIDAEYKDLDP